MNSKILPSSQAVWSLGLLAFALLCFLCIYWHAPQLLGAETAAATPAATTLVAPRLEARFLNGKVILTGTLPDQSAQAQVLARAKELYGAGQFIDNLQVNAQAAFPTQGWFHSALALLPLAARANNEGGFSIEGNIVTMRGLVDSDETKAKLISETTNAAGAGVRVEDRLTVKGKITTAQAAEFQTRLNQMMAGKIVEFDTGSDQLTRLGKTVLDEMVTALAAAPGIPVEIGGHTDAHGPGRFNQTLSQRRAQVCLRYLAQQGVAAKRLSAKGYGAAKPLAENHTPAGQQRNRRIEFTVLRGGEIIMGLLELALKMIACLVMAGLLGWIIGFLLGRIFGSANASELLNECEGRMRMREQEWGGLRADLTSANAKISSLQTELTTLATTLKTRDGWVTEMEGKNRELQADLDAHVFELDKLQAETEQAKSALTARWEKALAEANLEREKEQEITRLKVRITELEMMARDVKEPAVKVSPASALPPSPKEMDDLKRVYGIGPALEQLLHNQGVYWFRQIANWTQEDIQHYDELLEEFHGRIEREGWIASARAEHFKKYNEQV